jgi:peptidoglycan/xylan/chitin deacetylase (PgdA/CDA1 family)
MFSAIFNGCKAEKPLQNANFNTSYNEKKNTEENTNKPYEEITAVAPTEASKTLKWNDKGIPVIMYHSVKYEKDNPVRISKENFGSQMKYLKDNNYTTLSLDELHEFLENNLPVPEKSVVLTFDDGYVDNYTTAYPILKEYGFKATVFVITDVIGTGEYLTESQIKELDKNGIDIQSHTVKHENLSELSYDKQLTTLKESKEVLEKLLDKKIEYIAYPFGKYNVNTVRAVEVAGYKLALTTAGKWSDKTDGIYTLDRVYISGFHDIETFKTRISSPTYGANVETLTPKTDAKLQSELEAEYNKAYGLFFENKYNEAITIADNIIKKDANFYKAYNIKGIALCFSNNFESGMKNIDKSLVINPNFGYARFNKALAYELYGHYDDSLKWYDKALEVENYVWSHYGKASIYGRLGDVGNTVKYLKIAITMQESVKEEAKSEKDFDKVRNSKEFIELVK